MPDRLDPGKALGRKIDEVFKIVDEKTGAHANTGGRLPHSG